jgi:hypothetical protein
MAAGRQVQLIIRLLNDLGTYDRDVAWGDLNALMLGVSQRVILDKVAGLIDECRTLVGSLRTGVPRVADYLMRLVEFNIGFYQVADYWGTL